MTARRRLAALVQLAALWTTTALADPTDKTPAEILLGNRFLDETRFAQFFAAHGGPNVNAPLSEGDPVMATTVTTDGTLAGPFAGRSMNCRACHLDVEHKGIPGGGGRSYADFARRSPIPDRGDGEHTTVRNSQSLLNAVLPRPDALFLHFDGEFTSAEDLAAATLVGRNFGWLPNERALAVAHVARVVREDDGSDPAGTRFGGASYRAMLNGTAPLQPSSRLVPEAMRVDVTRLDDEQIVRVVARFLAVYMGSLVGSQDAAGAFDGSPYDVFLAKNLLPRQPRPRESPASYSRRLLRLLDRLDAPAFVSEADGHFTLHDQQFVFGPTEFEGLRSFLRTPNGPVSAARARRGGIGNCAACHPPPAFTDFRFHNTGAAEDEYEAIHGAGSFAALAVPDLGARNGDPDAALPPSSNHPHATGRFRAVPSADRPGFTDLGLWNLYANPDFPDDLHQRALGRMICFSRRRTGCGRGKLASPRLLAHAIGLFKTPGLRDLSHSGPYLHTGSKNDLEDVVDLYRRFGERAREGTMRNSSPFIERVALVPADVAPLAAFLRSLNEDFE